MPTTEHSHSMPRIASLCGTWLKAEMQSIYRQVTSLQRYESIVFTEQVQNPEQFPWPAVVKMTRQHRPRLRGNFVLRFWYKYMVRQWPPPRPIHKPADTPHHPYDLPTLLTEWHPQIVHVYYGHKAVKYQNMIRSWGGPWLVSFHGVDVVKFTEDPAYVEALQIVFRRAELVLARSRSLLIALEKLGCPVEKLRLNRTPIPLEKFTYAPRSTPLDGSWRLIQACRLIGKKGLFTTLAALQEVVSLYPNVKFIVCGTGPEREKFLTTVEQLGLSEHVELTGWMSQADLVAEYGRAHLFLHPSELTEQSDQEGIPNSMLEAMASGLPVIGTLHGGIPEAVTNGVEGLLVPEKSPHLLAEAILSLLGDPVLRVRLGAQAAASVREHFASAASIAKLEDCYTEAIARWEERHALKPIDS